jgi:flagellin-like protein
MRTLPSSRRAVSSIIATVFLVAMTVTAGAVLAAFRPPLHSAPSQINYIANGDATTETWGDGSDCKNVNTNQTCFSLPAIDVVLTQFSPSVISISDLYFYFFCNGTVYLGGPLAAMEWVPGSTAMVSPDAPQLGSCGTFVPPKAAFNRMVFFEQQIPGDFYLQPGDRIVLTAHTFEPPNCPAPGPMGQCDDDFHGAPEWCYLIPSACSMEMYYSGGTGISGSVLSISLYGLSS